jgi:hypothetical protein
MSKFILRTFIRAVINEHRGDGSGTPGPGAGGTDPYIGVGAGPSYFAGKVPTSAEMAEDQESVRSLTAQIAALNAQKADSAQQSSSIAAQKNVLTRQIRQLNQRMQAAV